MACEKCDRFEDALFALTGTSGIFSALTRRRHADT